MGQSSFCGTTGTPFLGLWMTLPMDFKARADLSSPVLFCGLFTTIPRAIFAGHCTRNLLHLRLHLKYFEMIFSLFVELQTTFISDFLDNIPLTDFFSQIRRDFFNLLEITFHLQKFQSAAVGRKIKMKNKNEMKWG